MKKKNTLKIDVSVSREHEKYKPEIRAAFADLDVHFTGGIVRLSAGDLPMQVMILLTKTAVSGIIGGAAWDLLKAGIGRLRKKFPKSAVTLRDPDSVMFVVRPDFTVSTIVISDRVQEFVHIKTFDDLAGFLSRNEKGSAPNGWRAVTIGEVATVTPSNVDKHVRSSEKPVLLFNYTDAYFNDQLTTRIGLSQGTATEEEIRKFRIRQGDVLITKDSETPDDIAHSCVSVADFDDVVCGYHLAIIRSNQKVLDGFFLKRLFDLPKVRNYFSSVANGATRFGLTKPSIEKAPIVIPSLVEQQRIVAVLETWDKAIENFKKKVAVKKAVEKVLMRRLLTSKSRLPGYKYKWRTAMLGNVGRIVSGGTPSKKRSEYWDGNIPWISSSDLDEGDIWHARVHRYITEDAIYESATTLIPPKSVVIVSRVGVGKLFVNDVSLCTSQDFQSLIIEDGKNDPYFIAYLLSIELQKLLLRNQGTSIKGLLKKDLEALLISVPEIVEQGSIVKVLAAADSEIAHLERKLAVIRDQKTYLLNNLMCGETRVPGVSGR